jgi:hypothetical protein
MMFDSTHGTNYVASSLSAGKCDHLGVVNVNDLNMRVQGLITSTLSGLINTGTFPIFLTRNVVAADPGHTIAPGTCCILGFHSGINVGSNFQIYSPFSLDTTGLFGGQDVSTLAHEMGEAINDPRVNNLTPAWGGIGQVPGCQGNFEVGDPLSPGGIAPTSNQFTVVGANGLTYHLQELAYFSWFYGGANLGTPGFFSNHSTFTGFAKNCPPGGTN